MSDKDLYSVLGVSRNADISEIRSAYKQLAKEHHPDKGGDPEKFKEISQAHEVLSSEDRRKMYDMTGTTSEHPDGHSGGPFPGGMPFPMAEMFGGMFSGMFPGSMGGAGVSRRREGKGPGKTQDLPLRISDYYIGRRLDVKLGRQSFCSLCRGSGSQAMETCSDCRGQGQVRQLVNMGPIQMLSQGICSACRGKGEKPVGKCNGCQGRGVLPEEKTLEITIEAGMMAGNTVVFSGMCSDSQGYTEPGDVTVVLREAEEEGDARNWIREANRLKTSIKINLTDALLGTKKLLYGHPGFPNGVPIEIPPGVQNMWSGTMPGLGMPIRGTPKFGEAYVSVIVVPTLEELVALKQQMQLLKSMFPQQPLCPETSETVRVGKWAAL